MKHFVHRLSALRIGVAYVVPGTQVASIVCEGLNASLADLRKLAISLSAEPAPYVQPEDRPLIKGFYGAAQGDLF